MTGHRSIDDAVRDAARLLAGRCRLDVDLGAMTTYRVGGRASVLVEPEDEADLDAIASAARRSGLPCLVIGRGSNMLVADTGVRAIVVSTARMTRRTDLVADGVIEAGAGTPLPMLARQSVALGLAGFEWAVGVPGSLGGAVRMNAGGHGSDIASCLDRARVFDLRAEGAGITVRSPSDLALGFRSSALHDGEIVLDARIRLRPSTDRDAGERTLADIVAWRRSHQPGGQNAGSVFVNPVPGEISAGALIDGLGLRGLRYRTAQVSTKHANFIQADRDGSAADVKELIDVVRRRVADATGYELRSEVRLVGFDGDPWSGA
jgi:UDP-N-acetylmuramate dehydrogenase